MSMPSSSTGSGTPPSEATASTTSNAPDRAAQLAKPVERLLDARRRLAVNHGQHARPMRPHGVDRAGSLSTGEPQAPSTTTTLTPCKRSTDVDHAVGEEAGVADDDRVARLEQIDQRGFHTAAAGGRQRQGGPIVTS